MELVAHIDFETASAANLKKTGVSRYFEHPSTRVWLARWCLWPRGSAPPRDALRPWSPDGADPHELLDHIARGGTVVAHNAAFERRCWAWLRRTLKPHWPDVPIGQWDCTMSRAAALALPLGLDTLCEVLKLPAKKDREGSALMMRMAKPRRDYICVACLGRGCDNCTAGHVYEWNDEPEKKQRLGAYCDDDVLAECGVDAVVLPLSARERRVWELDQRINDRGIRVDIELVHRIIATIAKATAKLNAEMRRITNGEVEKVSSAQALVKWINSRGIACSSIAKGEQEDLLVAANAMNDDLVTYAIELRQQAKSSTAKYQAMMACACADGRIRDLLQYHGATTGRWAGRLVQPQNLYRVDAERDGGDIDIALELLLRFVDPAEALDALDVVLAKLDAKSGATVNAPMIMIAKCIRSMFIPDKGKRFIGGDSANIEGRVNAWLAGETWKIEAFRQYDLGVGADLYNVSYANSFGGDPKQIKGMKRQIGKVQELALGYQGSIGAYISMMKNYGIKPRDIAIVVREVVTAETWEVARLRYHWKGQNQYGLPEDEWTALRIVVNNWRARHPAIVQSWWDYQDAAIEAVAEPDKIVDVCDGKVRYMSARGFLWCALPSSRLIAYHNPRLIEVDSSYVAMLDGSRVPAVERFPHEIDELLKLGGKYIERTNRKVLYSGFENETRRWVENFSLYGGMQCENISQATARDTLVDFAFEAEARGYPVVLTVHDELLTEVEIGRGSAAELREIMQTNSEWNRGLPLAAKTWEGDRYNK